VRRLARGSSTGARSCAFARGDHIREGWPPHERTVHDGTASPAKVQARFAAPTTGEEATQRGDPERGEGRGTQRPPGRGGARGATGPRARALRSSAPEAAEGQRREPEARADRAQQSRGPEGRSERSEARAPRRAPARGRRGTDRHPRVTCPGPAGSGRESSSRTTSVRTETLHQTVASCHRGRSGVRGGRGRPPTAHGTRRSSGDPGRRGPAWSSAVEPRACPGEPRWSRGLVLRGQVSQQAARARARAAEPGRASGAVRPDRRADPRLSGAADRDQPAPVGGNSVRCEQEAAAR
jgi:hypothetical protein